MKIIKKGTLTIDGEDSEISGYTFDLEGESMLSATICMLEEGIRDLQAQIEKAKAEGLNITDGGNNHMNGEAWKFPFVIKLRPTQSADKNIRWIDNYTATTSMDSLYAQSIQVPRIDAPSDK